MSANNGKAKRPTAGPKPAIKVTAKPATKASAPGSNVATRNSLRGKAAEAPAPSDDVAPPKRKRRTPEEMKAVREAAAEAAAAKEVKRVKGMEAVASMENSLAAEDANAATPRNPMRNASSGGYKPSTSAFDDDHGSELTNANGLASAGDTETEYESEGGRHPEMEDHEMEEDYKMRPPSRPRPIPKNKGAAPKAPLNEEDVEVTPMAKKKKSKTVTRDDINKERLSKPSPEDADLDQKAVKRSGPRQETSKFVDFLLYLSTCSPSMKPRSFISPLLVIPPPAPELSTPPSSDGKLKLSSHSTVQNVKAVGLPQLSLLQQCPVGYPLHSRGTAHRLL